LESYRASLSHSPCKHPFFIGQLIYMLYNGTTFVH